jgi:hypothetical protein
MLKNQLTRILQPAATTLTGRDLSIVPGPQATDGIDIYLGPDLANDIKAAGKTPFL